MNEKSISKKSIFGLILILIGVVSILNSLNVIDVSYYFDRFWDMFFWNIGTYWPVIIILLGVRSIVGKRRNTLLGIGVTALGTLLLVDNLNFEVLSRFDLYEMVIPFIVILIGVHFVLQQKGQSSKSTGVEETEVVVDLDVPAPPKPPKQPKPEKEAEKVDEKASEEAKEAVVEEDEEITEVVTDAEVIE